MKNNFAIVCEWPKSNSAENETIKRFKFACNKINKGLIIIDKFGNILNEDFKKTTKIISNNDVDFIINLHFASPKAYDGYSFVALWNPLKFYFDWGYEYTSLNLITHHDFISCNSDIADDHIKRLIDLIKSKHLYPELVLNHTNSGPYHNPNNQREKIFYCGINWDKFTGKSRFEDIFKELDNKSLLKIFGPRKLTNKIEPWKDFKSYCGDIPFDGISVFKEISGCLLGLALSHEAHIESEIATSRIFELIAGGALPICDENVFFLKYFKDKVLFVNGSDKEKTSQIIEHYKWAINNRDKVKEMVESLQDYMKNNFDLSNQISKLYDSFEIRRTVVENSYCAQKKFFKVNIFFICDNECQNQDITLFLNSMKNQIYKNIEVYILKKNEQIKDILISNEYHFKINQLNHTVNEIDRIGLIIEQTVSKINFSENSLFLLTNRNETFFYDHISSMVRCFEDNDVKITKSEIAISNQPDKKKDPDLFKTDSECLNVLGNILFKEIPKSHILKYISILRFSISFIDLYEKKTINTNRLTLKFNHPDKQKQFATCNSVSIDIELGKIKESPKIIIRNQQLVIDKKIAYQIINNIKAFKIIVIIRNIIKKINNKLKCLKKSYNL
jgi:hypothetical protein